MVNATFQPIEDVRRLARLWIDTYSDRVRGLFLDRENQQFIRVRRRGETESRDSRRDDGSVVSCQKNCRH